MNQFFEARREERKKVPISPAPSHPPTHTHTQQYILYQVHTRTLWTLTKP